MLCFIFFTNCKMPRIVNITLVPKVLNPSRVTDFRPISCCNVAYKCVAKMLADRLMCVLPELITLFKMLLYLTGLLEIIFLLLRIFVVVTILIMELQAALPNLTSIKLLTA